MLLNINILLVKENGKEKLITFLWGFLNEVLTFDIKTTLNYPTFSSL